MENPLVELYGEFEAPKTVQQLEQLTGIPSFEPDPSQGHRGLVVLEREWLRENMVTEWFPILGMRYVNKHMAAPLYAALMEIDAHPDEKYREYFNLRECGIFVARTTGWKPGNRLSMHAMGLALDINWGENPWGKRTGTIRQYPWLITAFKKNGFTWGGDWTSKPDDMHFQYAGSGVVLPRS